MSFDAKGKQHLEVAESITPNEDATTYTIKLKKGWKFTNGEAVTAHSFADTWKFRRQCEERAEDRKPILHHQGL